MPPDAQGIPLPQAAAERVSLSAALAQGGGNFRGAYVHVPFCRHKCHYCDFYSFVDGDGRADAYVDRALAEMAAWKPLVNGSLRTLFVGGGTPTMLAPAQLGRLLGGLRTSFNWDEGAEWTVEANPETVTPEIAATLRAAGRGWRRLLRRLNVDFSNFVQMAGIRRDRIEKATQEST